MLYMYVCMYAVYVCKYEMGSVNSSATNDKPCGNRTIALNYTVQHTLLDPWTLTMHVQHTDWVTSLSS